MTTPIGQPKEADSMIMGLETRERRARNRSLIYSCIPVIFTIGFLTYAGTEYRSLQRQIDVLKPQVDALNAKVVQSQEDVRRANQEFQAARSGIESSVQSMSEIQAFIEREKPFLRSEKQAQFLISVNMLFDNLRKADSALAKGDPELTAQLRNDAKKYFVVVSSSSDREALIELRGQLNTRMPGEKFALEKSPNGYYALVIEGDGTFTTAYRRTVVLKNSGVFQDAYFSDATGFVPVGE